MGKVRFRSQIGYHSIALLAAILAVGFVKPAQAEDAPLSANSTMMLPSDLATHPSVSTKNFLSLELEQMNYNTGSQTGDQLNQYTQISPRFNFARQWGDDDSFHNNFAINGLTVVPMSSGSHFEVAVPNAFWGFGIPEEHFKFSVGRQLQNWSELDDFWHLGIWQPLARWDAASPITQGLTGAFAQLSEDQFRMTIFASGLFLPDQQPDFKESNGQITSDNRWFRAPVSQIGLGNSELTVTYQISTPDTKDVIFQRSLAIMTEVGQAKEGPFLKASYAQKPANQFHVGLDTRNALKPTNIVNVPVVPVVVNEKVLTAESGYRFSEGEVVISDTWERFENPNLPTEYEQAELIDSQYIGAIARHSLQTVGVKRAQMALSYVQRVKETNSSSDTIIRGQVESSADRMAFDKLAGLQFRKNIFQKFQSGLDVEFDYIYSISDRGEWVRLMTSYQYDRRWTWSLASDIFGLPASEASSPSFISMYRGNDRTIAGLTYVF